MKIRGLAPCHPYLPAKFRRYRRRSGAGDCDFLGRIYAGSPKPIGLDKANGSPQTT